MPADPTTPRPNHDRFPDIQPIVLRLVPEYTDEVPVFPRSDDTDAPTPPALLHRMVAWNRYFNENFQWDEGWRSEEAKINWAEGAVPLVAEFKDVLAGKAEPGVDLWPEMRGVMESS
jgi:hypothetical protein